MSFSSIWSFFEKGGPVMWPILFLSVLMLAIVAERLFRYTRVRLGSEDLPERVANALVAERKKDALAAIEDDRGIFGPILAAASEVKVDDRETLETVIIDAQQAVVGDLDRYLATLAAIGNLAPVLGLLGTVTGMIKAFMVIQETGGKVNAAVLAGGIWEAMLTTAFGLIVAVPTILAHSYLVMRVDRIHNVLQTRAVNFIKALSAKRERAA
jgi:biopolymer transport protein ExbB